MKDLARQNLTELADELERDATAAPADTAARLSQAVEHIRAAIALLETPSDHE